MTEQGLKLGFTGSRLGMTPEQKKAFCAPVSAPESLVLKWVHRSTSCVTEKSSI